MRALDSCKQRVPPFATTEAARASFSTMPATDPQNSSVSADVLAEREKETQREKETEREKEREREAEAEVDGGRDIERQ